MRLEGFLGKNMDGRTLKILQESCLAFTGNMLFDLADMFNGDEYRLPFANQCRDIFECYLKQVETGKIDNVN